MTEKICSICQREFTEYGNNAQPVNDGHCCDECDWVVVIPARLRRAPGAIGSWASHQEAMAQARKVWEQEKEKRNAT